MIKEFIDYNDYIDLLSDKETLCVSDFKNYNKGIINRHDVDYSLDLAYELSRYELKNNIKATYYILLTSDAYNPFSSINIKKIKQMAKDGFEIGLHFDPCVYGNLSKNELIKKMNNELHIFECYFDLKVKSYSMHNPSINGEFIKHNEILNAYDEEIFNNNIYISDSSFSFRDKDLKEFLEQSKNKRIQFLTHPVHLFSDRKISYEKPLNRIINDYYKKLDNIWSINKIYYAQKETYNIIIGDSL